MTKSFLELLVKIESRLKLRRVTAGEVARMAIGGIYRLTGVPLGCFLAMTALSLHAATVQSLDSLDASIVLSQLRAAMGGCEAIRQIQTREMHATMTIGWLKLRIHTLQEWPDRIVEYATVPLLGMRSSSGYDGASGWVQESGKASRRMQGPELADYLLEHRMDRICELDRLYPQRRRLPDVTIEGRAHVSLSMTPAHAAAQTWMIDAQTGLLTKIEGWRRRNGKVAPTSTRLSDYRSIGGAVLPFRLTGDDGEHSYTITVDSVVHGKPVDIAAPPDLPRAPHTPGE